jgi:hypothetical protein
MAKSTKRIAFGADQPSACRLPSLRFSVIVLSCKANVRVYDAKSGHGPHAPTPHPGAAASPKRLKKSHNFSLRMSQSGLRTQTANQPKFIPPIISPGLPRPSSLARSVKALSLTSKSLALAYSRVRVKVCVIEPSYAVKRRYG